MLCRVYQGRLAEGVRDWLLLNGIDAFLRPPGEGPDYEWGSVFVLAPDLSAAQGLLVQEDPFTGFRESEMCTMCRRLLIACWCDTDGT